jgi:hypothetical protein
MLECLIIAGQLFFINECDDIFTIVDEEDIFSGSLDQVANSYPQDCV